MKRLMKLTSFAALLALATTGCRSGGSQATAGNAGSPRVSIAEQLGGSNLIVRPASGGGRKGC
ncbi:MAG: hypothetical protein CMJ48_00145 [Planctomycetaceae bacterium]|nr:hypothetical protein [Planctomycetaceae bacterium]